MIQLHHVVSQPLHYDTTCGLIGVSPDRVVYAEELYDDWIAQHAIQLDGGFITTVDEQAGRNRQFVPLQLPSGSVYPQSDSRNKALNFTGPRHRGLQEAERIRETVRPLSMQSKMALVDRLRLDVLPPMILGLVESRVISEAALPMPNQYIVCRRIRIAFGLPPSHQRSYDYDSIELHIAHPYNSELQDELSVDEAFAGLPGVQLIHPTDCILSDGYLFLADGGRGRRRNQIHVWRIEGTA